MTEKDTYTAQEVADILCVKLWKIREMLRLELIEHQHLNDSHANARIPRAEVERLTRQKA